MRTLIQDLHYGLRLLVKNPGFTIVAVLSLALGIGANTAIFSIVDKTLARPLSVKEPERLVMLGARHTRGVNESFSYPNYVDYRDRNEVFEGLVCYFQTPLSLSGDVETERARRLPGVESASLASAIPLSGDTSNWSVEVEGYQPQPDENLLAEYNVVGALRRATFSSLCSAKAWRLWV